MTDSDRPTPEQMLARLKTEGDTEAAGQTKRGRLKVFFGYSAGVGKTYSMLLDARSEQAAGMDVVVGYVEPHGRPETEKLLEGLERLAALEVPYRGTTLREFDLDAALARKPKLILVDELAHTNAPSLRHVKRWQDVEELLEAGINVNTTCNVQHVESLNDIVAQISGVIVRETVPDEVFNRADELTLIDLPPEDLLERLEQGKVYIPAQAARALENFFRKGNLIALRELALRRTAERVHADVQTARLSRARHDVWATRERLLVCVGPSPTSARLVRAAKRLADSLGAEWIAINVDSSQTADMSAKDRARLLAHLQLAERLGAETATVSGDDLVAETIQYAQQRNVTKIVVGKSELTRGWFRPRQSPADRLIRESGDIDVYVIHGITELVPHVAPPPQPVSIFRWRVWIGTAVVLAACTAFALLWHRLGLTEANLVMTYLLGVMFIAFRYGRGPSIVASLVSVVLFDVIFTRPYYTVVVNDTQYLITFAVMLVAGLSIAALTARVRRQAESARRNERRIEALYRLGRKLTGIVGEDFIAAETERAVSEFLGGETAVILPRAGKLQPILDHRARFAADPSEIAVAQWVFDHGQPAGRGTDTLPSARALYLPLQSPNGTMGVLAVRHGDATKLLLPEFRQILENYSTQVALAIERDRLTLESDKARFQAETERIRSTLLSSISHDLRTPLAVIVGASSSLLHGGTLMNEETRRELLETVFEESDHLSRLVENILRMTQLSSAETPAINKEWQPVEEIVASALRRLERTLSDRPVSVNLPPEVLLAHVDAVLVEQVIMNLLDNACRYTPAGTPIELNAWRDGDKTVLEVADHGPGLKTGEEQRVFERFQRGNGAKSDSRGAGLGLAICRAIMDAHGGGISARNRDGGGAVFRLEFVADSPPPRDFETMEATAD
jgi:two-component system, OmpR family, sensor histidine kinase KdpD